MGKKPADSQQLLVTDSAHRMHCYAVLCSIMTAVPPASVAEGPLALTLRAARLLAGSDTVYSVVRNYNALILVRQVLMAVNCQ
jgi:hypothetical protein